MTFARDPRLPGSAPPATEGKEEHGIYFRDELMAGSETFERIVWAENEPTWPASVVNTQIGFVS